MERMRDERQWGAAMTTRQKRIPEPNPGVVKSGMAEKRPRGRPSLYRPEYADQARAYANLGATDAEIADLLEIDYATFRRWTVAHADLCAALKVGKEASDERVAKSLYMKAMGYEHDVEKVVVIDGVPTTITVRERIPPSDTAAIFWLKNRRPGEWRDRKELATEGEAIQVVIKKVGDA